MLNGRIYRMGLIAVAVAVIVFAFSLGHAQGPLGSTLAPDAFDPGSSLSASYAVLARQYPDPLPGSSEDDALAGYVARQLGASNFVVSTHRFRASTPLGVRTLENVIGVRAGSPGAQIVVVSHRDLLRRAPAALSGTAVMLELASVLSGETLNHPVVLASISGSAGGAGAAQLARELGGPIDAVIVLGDMVGQNVQPPVIVPWSNSGTAAPEMLRNTVAAALESQAQLGPGQSSLAGQFLHLAFPIATTEQSQFDAGGQPAVLLSLSGDHPPTAGEPTNPGQLDALGRAVLASVTALEAGPQVPAPSAYLVYNGNVVPSWAVSLLALALIVPVLAATIDGLARARRRRQWVLRWVVWVLSAAIPFLLAVLAIVIAKLAGVIGDATPDAVIGGVAMHSAGLILLIATGCLVLVGLVLVRPRVISLIGLAPDRRPQDVTEEGATAALMAVLCVVALAVWVVNPFAALLLAPALNLWLWAVAPEVRPPLGVLAVLAIGGLVLPVLAAIYCASVLGVGPAGLVWVFTTLVASGSVGVLAAVELAIMLGCTVSFAVIAVARAREPRTVAVAVTVRGPITYAGPGSLGGTRSALRR